MEPMLLTDFRNNLTDVVDGLAETGPVRLARYNDVVAEIRAATPEGERAYARDIRGIFRYLDDLDAELVEGLFRSGVDTLVALAELVERHKAFVSSGVTFSRYPGDCLPAEGPITVDEALARLYFDEEYPEGVDSPHAWFLACASLQREAQDRGMATELPCPNAYDEENPGFVQMAVASGHTPDSLVDFGVRALDQGVALKRLSDMLGPAPVPADVLALEEYNDYRFEQLTEAGLPHAEAVAVFRRGLSRDAVKWAEAGLRSADEIEKVAKERISLDLARRAAREGLAPEEWRVQVPKIQHLRYRGVEREGGVLPFRLLVEAAEKGISLVRWDSNSMPVDAERNRPSFYATAAQRTMFYPWSEVYPDRVLELARAGVSPSYVSAFAKLMERQRAEVDDFTALAIQAHEAGLTSAMANAMARQGSQRPRFSPEQLLSVLEEGLSSVGAARFLADTYRDPDAWIAWLRERRDRQPMTDTFVARVENTRAWRTAHAAALEMKKLLKKRLMRGDTYLTETVSRFVAGKSLNDVELKGLLNNLAHLLKELRLPNEWLDEYGQYAHEVRELAEEFNEFSKADRPQGGPDRVRNAPEHRRDDSRTAQCAAPDTCAPGAPCSQCAEDIERHSPWGECLPGCGCGSETA